MTLRDVENDMNKVISCVMISLCLFAPNARAEVIDMLIVYDNSATEWVGANGGMTAFSYEAVNRLSQAARNSGLDLEFRCVKFMSVDYDYASSMSGALVSLRDGDGVFQSVHEARDAYGADLVAMLVDTGSAYGNTGTGFLLTTWNGCAEIGFSVCSIRSMSVSDSFTHEVGHNLGADHSKYQAADYGPNQYLDNEYSAGWYFTGQEDGCPYHTIMAYNYDGFGNIYSPTGLFSSPLVDFKGTTAGDAADGDNCRLIRLTQSIVANYRVTKKNICIPSIHLLLLP